MDRPPHSPEDGAAGRRAEWLLALGAAVGLMTAASSLVGPGDGAGGLPDGVIARVNGTEIREDDYLRAVTALASDRRSPLDDDDRRTVLDRLIEEELLVQHALALGLAEHDRRVRADLVSAVLGSLVASTDGYEPDDREVAHFYDENADYFARPGRVWVRQVFVATEPRRSDDEARARATRARDRLRGGTPLRDVREALGDSEIAVIPDAPLPPAKLRSYVGPTAMQAALTLEQGAVSDPVRSAQGYHVLQCVSREPARQPPLSEIRDQVQAEVRRRAGDRAVRDRLDSLRAAADLVVAGDSP